MIMIPHFNLWLENRWVDILRLDIAHPISNGNKWFKLEYNLEEAKRLGNETILSFGGTFSNHIYALAEIGKNAGFNTIGIIRGEDDPQNPTLHAVRENGMILHFISREQYRNKYDPIFLAELKNKFGEFYLLPEGGTNSLAVKGCSEILETVRNNYDRIFCAVGTGGTLAGIISTPGLSGSVEGIVVLKGAENLEEQINKLIWREHTEWKLNHDYHFGGYAKYSDELIDFIRWFKTEFDMLLDPVYTGKLMYAVSDMIKTGKIDPSERILTIHTGGLQGVTGWEYRFGKIMN